MNAPQNEKITITACGDPAIDFFEQGILHHDHVADTRADWIHRPGHALHRLGGGVLLLSRFVDMAITELSGTVSAPIADLDLPNFHRVDQSQSVAFPGVIQSLAQISPAGKADADDGWFVSTFKGFNYPSAAAAKGGATVEETLWRGSSPSSPTIAVIDDGGNVFRNDKTYWPQWLTTDQPTPIDLLLLKLNWPLPLEAGDTSNQLFERFAGIRARDKIIIVNGNDLRRKNFRISGQLSWERTLYDLKTFIEHHLADSALLRCDAHLVVRFATEGTAIATKGAIRDALKQSPNRCTVRLIADPARIESEHGTGNGRNMPGQTSAFVAALAAYYASDRARRPGTTDLREADLFNLVQRAMDSALKLVSTGFKLVKDRERGSAELAVPGGLFPECRQIGNRHWTRYTLAAEADTPRYLLPDEEGEGETDVERLRHLSKAIVLRGETALARHTHARFGDMLLADWREVESYRYIANLIRKYVRGTQRRPLSIAVFGAPGSGKSFGITQIAKTLSAESSGTRINPLTFNVAQWRETADLISALHQVRDRAISGDMPLVFFDEFDCSNPEPLSWLKMFLAPMQDGEFSDGKHIHSIGRSIFVFAGGTSRSLAGFRDGNGGKGGDAEKTNDTTSFTLAKGPDFLSRLSGYVDIRGIGGASTPQDGTTAIEARLVELRCAVLLRNGLKQDFPSIFNAAGEASIDHQVVSALLTSASFIHGARSMEAILRMSSADRTSPRLTKAHLPPKEQLQLHIRDVEAFLEAIDVDLVRVPR